MKCAHCGHRLIQRKDGVVKLRSPVLIFSTDGASCRVVCPECKAETSAPLTLDKKAVPAEPRLVIERVRALRPVTTGE